MKSSELRIGNKLLKDGVVVTIDGRSIFDIWSSELPHSTLNHPYEPIPLTEEWLLKFKFMEDEPYLSLPIDNYNVCEICYSQYHKKISLFTTGSHYFLDTKYVHQLQNLYFSLTGEELVLNLKS